jgi:GT2 family glycosyltransferase
MRRQGSRPVSVIVLNYNGASIIARAVRADLAEARKVHPASEVTVVDNASTDGSADIVRRKFPKVRVLPVQRNRFLHAFNDAIRLARNDAVILINNDMIPQPGCFSRLMAALTPGVFSVGPKILWPDRKTINFAYARPRFWRGFFSVERVGADERDEGQCDFERPIMSLYPPIASAFDRKKLLQLGGFDAIYDPAYWEDVDLGYSAWKRGWRTLYDSKAVTVHDHQRTIEKGNKKSDVLYWINKNKHLFIIKNISDNGMRAQYALALPFIVAAGTARHGPAFLWGFLGAARRAGGAWKRGRQEKKGRRLSDSDVFLVAGARRK